MIDASSRDLGTPSPAGRTLTVPRREVAISSPGTQVSRYAAGPQPPDRPRTPATRRPLFIPSAMLTIVALLALVFVVTLSVIGPIQYDRDQQTAYAQLRSDLANATTEVTQTDENNNLYPLGTALGVIDIPQLGVREVILEGTTAQVLMSGPGHRRDTPLPGQAGISVVMGRQTAFGGPFGSLHQLQPRDVFFVTTGQGRQTFRVRAVRRAGDPAPPPVAAGGSRIILVTAAGNPWVPEGLLRVDADLVGRVQPSGPRPLTAAQLPDAEQPLQVDPGVWVQIMLLSQALAAAAVATTVLRYRWGRWQAWLSGAPVLLALAVALCDQAACLLPNLM